MLEISALKMTEISDMRLGMCRITDMKDMILFRLADQIKSMRIRRGLSQSDLAAAAGVNRKTIIELEKGCCRDRHWDRCRGIGKDGRRADSGACVQANYG